MSRTPRSNNRTFDHGQRWLGQKQTTRPNALACSDNQPQNGKAATGRSDFESKRAKSPVVWSWNLHWHFPPIAGGYRELASPNKNFRRLCQSEQHTRPQVIRMRLGPLSGLN
jgi:hypothetical protein